MFILKKSQLYKAHFSDLFGKFEPFVILSRSSSEACVSGNDFLGFRTFMNCGIAG